MTAIKTLLLRLLRLAWTGAALLIIFVALLVSIIRMLMPLLNDYRHEIEDLASKQLGREIRVGEIKAEWLGFWPSLGLHQIQIMSPNGKRVWLSAEDIRISINLMSIFSEHKFDPGEILIRGANLEVVRNDDESYSVNGERLQMEKASELGQEQLIKWIFARDQLGILDSRFTLRDKRISDQKLEIRNSSFFLEGDDDDHHRLRGSFQLPGQGERTVSFIMELNGNVLEPGSVASKLYLEGDLLVTDWLRKRLHKYIVLDSGEIHARLWGQGNLKQINQIESSLDMQKVLWTLPEDGLGNTPVTNRIDELKGLVFWNRQKQGWALDIEQLELKRMGRSWPGSEFHLVYRSDEKNGESSLEGRATFLRLQDINALMLAHLPGDLEYTTIARALNARGDLRDLEFSFRDSPREKDRLYLKTRFQDFGYNRWKKIPGVEGVDGEVVLDQEHGYIDLESTHSSVNFGDLFRAPLTAERMHGKVYWSRGPNGIKVEAPLLDVVNENITSQSRAVLEFPKNGKAPFLDLRASFENGNAAFAGDFYPRKIMHPNVIAWLDRALVEGDMPRGGMVFHGRTSDFPFDHGKGTFLVRFDVENLTLDFMKHWPQVKGFGANVLFTGRSMFVDVEKGNIVGLEALPSRIAIEDLSKKAVLDLNAKLQGSTADTLRLLNESPAGKGYRDFLKTAKSSGNTDVELSLQLPLGKSKSKSYTLKGKVDLHNSSLDLPEWDRSFRDINGQLDFRSDGKRYFFTARKMKVDYYGKKATIDVRTESLGKTKLATHVDLRGRMDVATLTQDNVPVLPRYLKGDANWLLSLVLTTPGRNNLHDAQLRVESDLKGIEIDLPDGLGKRAKEQRLLRADITLGKSEIIPVSLHYTGGLNAVLAIRKIGKVLTLENGEVIFGKKKAALRAGQKGIHIGGELATLSLSRWMSVGKGSNDVDHQRIKVTDQISSVDLKINDLEAGGHHFHELDLQLGKQKSNWQADVKAKEMAGSITIPMQLDIGEPIEANLDFLFMETAKPQADAEVPDPRRLPSFNARIKSLVLNKIPLGDLRLLTRKIEQGLSVEELQLTAPALNIQANGTWLFRNSWHQSRFDIRAKTRYVEEALEMWKYKANIEGVGEAVVNASWNGPPHWFEMARLNGDVHLVIKEGRLRDVSPGGGRIFGLLSIQALPRRLTLDFSDLFKKGLSFDKIEGHFTISDGDAYTNDLYLDGPAAHIDIAGRIGLADQDYDQTVVVIPRLTSSIPVIGGIAAGPQVGIGLFLADKLFGSKINKMTAVRYNVTGKWDDPQFERLNGTNDQ